MDVYHWEDGFTPYSATIDGVTLTERQGDTVERVSRLVRRPAWDGHPNATDYQMADGFASGEVDGIAAAWVDGQAYELAPSGDFDCCAYGDGHAAQTCTVPEDCTTECLFTGVPCNASRARELAPGDRARASVPSATWDTPRHVFTGDVLHVWSRVLTISCPDHFAHNVPTITAVAL